MDKKGSRPLRKKTGAETGEERRSFPGEKEPLMALYDDVAAPARRTAQGHFATVRFSNLPLPHTFPDGSTAFEEEVEGGRRILVYSGDGSIIMASDEDGCVAAAPFMHSGRLYICECLHCSSGSLEVTEEELRTLTGMEPCRFTGARRAVCRLCINGRSGDAQVLDITPSSIWLCTCGGSEPSVAAIRKEEFGNMCTGIWDSRHEAPSEDSARAMGSRAAEEACGILDRRMHDIAGSLPALDFSKMFTGGDRLKQICIMEHFQTMECRLSAGLRGMEPDINSGSSIPDLPGYIKDGLPCECIISDSDGKVLALQDFGKPGYFAITGIEKNCVRLMQHGMGAETAFCLSREEFAQMYNKGKEAAAGFLDSFRMDMAIWDMEGYCREYGRNPGGQPEVQTVGIADYDCNRVWMVSRDAGIFAVPWAAFLRFASQI